MSKALRETFTNLDSLLRTHRALWTESAFTNDELSWAPSFPELHQTLLRLSDEALGQISDEEKLLSYLSTYLPALSTTKLGILSDPQVAWGTPSHALHGLPERKRIQTEGFVSALLQQQNFAPQSILDWCSGRGFLARQLYYAFKVPVTCLERDSELCESGKTSQQKLDPVLAEHVSFITQDVLHSISEELLASGHLHTALHACGDLHVRMLEKATEAQAPSIACSPCCYHSIKAEQYNGLSTVARQLGLKPTREELRLATAETCTANRIEKTLRQRELLWRVAFDLRVREVTGLEQYQPAPSVRKSLLKGGFSPFAGFLLQELKMRGRPMEGFFSPSFEEHKLLRRARRKLARIQRLEKAQLGFRKVLEYWLLLDRALFLQERGYEARLLKFCSKKVSGRNVLIFAHRLG